MIIYLQDRLEN